MCWAGKDRDLHVASARRTIDPLDLLTAATAGLNPRRRGVGKVHAAGPDPLALGRDDEAVAAVGEAINLDQVSSRWC